MKYCPTLKAIFNFNDNQDLQDKTIHNTDSDKCLVICLQTSIIPIYCTPKHTYNKL